MLAIRAQSILLLTEEIEVRVLSGGQKNKGASCFQLTPLLGPIGPFESGRYFQPLFAGSPALG
jgi:hypothetical protein